MNRLYVTQNYCVKNGEKFITLEKEAGKTNSFMEREDGEAIKSWFLK